jgi:hypothetical protein
MLPRSLADRQTDRQTGAFLPSRLAAGPPRMSKCLSVCLSAQARPGMGPTICLSGTPLSPRIDMSVSPPVCTRAQPGVGPTVPGPTVKPRRSRCVTRPGCLWSVYQEPCLTLVLPDVICSDCSDCRDLDLCRDPELQVGGFAMHFTGFAATCAPTTPSCRTEATCQAFPHVFAATHGGAPGFTRRESCRVLPRMFRRAMFKRTPHSHAAPDPPTQSLVTESNRTPFSYFKCAVGNSDPI